MPRNLPPIPQWAPVSDQQGMITLFFRQLWQILIDGWNVVPATATSITAGLTAATAATTVLSPTQTGFVRVSYYLRKTVADGTSSSLTFTWGWTQGGEAFSASASALTTDTNTAEQDGSRTIYADSGTAVTFSVAYASNTPGKMTYSIDVAAEQLV